MTPRWPQNFCLMALKRFLSGVEEALERSPRLSSCGVEEFLRSRRISLVVPWIPFGSNESMAMDSTWPWGSPWSWEAPWAWCFPMAMGFPMAIGLQGIHGSPDTTEYDIDIGFTLDLDIGYNIDYIYRRYPDFHGFFGVQWPWGIPWPWGFLWPCGVHGH